MIHKLAEMDDDQEELSGKSMYNCYFDTCCLLVRASARDTLSHQLRQEGLKWLSLTTRYLRH